MADPLQSRGGEAGVGVGVDGRSKTLGESRRVVVVVVEGEIVNDELSKRSSSWPSRLDNKNENRNNRRFQEEPYSILHTTK